MHSPSTCGRRKEPHPVRTHADAVGLFTKAAGVPLQHEILGLVLDRGGRADGDRIYIISDTVEPDAVLRVTELLVCVAEGSPYSRLVVATVRIESAGEQALERPDIAPLGLKSILVQPLAAYAGRDITRELTNVSSLTADLRPRVFLDGLPGWVVYASEIRPAEQERLLGAIVYQMDRTRRDEQLHLAKEARLVPDFSRSHGILDFSPSGALATFTGKRLLGWDVFVLDLASGRATPLTSGGKSCRGRFSPDGRTIAFVSSTADGWGDVWTMKPDGTEKTRRTTTGGQADYFPSWSPDGKEIVFDLLGDIYEMPIEGTGGRGPSPGLRASRARIGGAGTAGVGVLAPAVVAACFKVREGRRPPLHRTTYERTSPSARGGSDDH